MRHTDRRHRAVMAAVCAAAALTLCGCEATLRPFKAGNNTPKRTHRPSGFAKEAAYASVPVQKRRQRVLDKWLAKLRGAPRTPAEPAEEPLPIPSTAPPPTPAPRGRPLAGRDLDRAFDEPPADTAGGAVGAQAGAPPEPAPDLVPTAATAPVSPSSLRGVGVKRTNDISARGRFHLITAPETVAGIAARYGVPEEALHRWNAREARAGFPQGVMIYVPSSEEIESARPVKARAQAGKVKRKTKAARTNDGSRVVAQMRAPASLLWPVDGRVVAPFGASQGRSHPGIDIGAPPGTPVHAAAAGRVIFSGPMKGYGQVVILDHEDGTFTVYGHNQNNLAVASTPESQVRVAQGETIALVGQTGSATRPALHFEVRRGNDPVDPLTRLPARTGSTVDAMRPAHPAATPARGKSRKKHG